MHESQRETERRLCYSFRLYRKANDDDDDDVDVKRRRNMGLEDGEGDGDVGGGNRKVIVGVKWDTPSRELLTWALVKVAQPGDYVIALHVLETDTGELYSTLSVKAFWVGL